MLLFAGNEWSRSIAWQLGLHGRPFRREERNDRILKESNAGHARVGCLDRILHGLFDIQSKIPSCLRT